MAERKRKKAKKGNAKTVSSGGPFLAAAFFCEKLIEEKDRVLSALRIIDQITVLIPEDAPPNFPSEEARLPLQATALVSLKTGSAQGEHEVRLVVVSPSGKKDEAWRQTVNLAEKAHGGHNFRLNLTFGVSEGGLFWLDVFVDGRRVTRMPLQIVVERGQVPSGAAAESPPG